MSCKGEEKLKFSFLSGFKEKGSGLRREPEGLSWISLVSLWPFFLGCLSLLSLCSHGMKC